MDESGLVKLVRTGQVLGFGVGAACDMVKMRLGEPDGIARATDQYVLRYGDAQFTCCGGKVIRITVRLRGGTASAAGGKLGASDFMRIPAASADALKMFRQEGVAVEPDPDLTFGRQSAFRLGEQGVQILFVEDIASAFFVISPSLPGGR
jgi:hypothetical protein